MYVNSVLVISMKHEYKFAMDSDVFLKSVIVSICWSAC